MDSPSKNKTGSVIDVRTGRRNFLRTAAIAGAALPFPGLVLAKGDDPWPSYYPSDYHSIVEGSKKESGLAIYSNMDTYNWDPILKGFQKKYPWVKSIKSNNLSSAEVFERYYSESATGTSPASLMVSGDPTSWVRMAKKQALLDYKSPEVAHLPDFAEPMPNLYTFSADPILMAYNTALLSEKERPQGIGPLVDLITKDPKRFKGKITTYDIAVSFGFAIFYSWLKSNPDHGWDTLGKLLSMTRPERSSGPMVNKLQTGEDLVGYFVSSTVVIPQATKSAGLLGWSYISDGTPMFLRGMGIPKTAPQVNTAKLMLDYILSQEGQISVYDGGFTPYRNGLPAKAAPRTYESIEAKLGKKNMIIIGYDDVSKEDAQKLTQKWKSYLK